MSEKPESAAGISSPRLLGSAAARAERVACSLWYHARYDRPGQSSEKITPALMPEENVPTMSQAEHFVPVKRKLTPKEKADAQIKLYSPCACGSGKKFKFCCRKPQPNK